MLDKDKCRKIINDADIAQLGKIFILQDDEYDAEIDEIIRRINTNNTIDIFTIRNIIYDVFVEFFHINIVYKKNNKIYSIVAKKIYKLIKGE